MKRIEKRKIKLNNKWISLEHKKVENPDKTAGASNPRSRDFRIIFQEFGKRLGFERKTDKVWN